MAALSGVEMLRIRINTHRACRDGGRVVSLWLGEPITGTNFEICRDTVRLKIIPALVR